ncbi:MAG: hypothetical protein ACRCZ8_10640, partial [Aeromonas sobria]
GGYGDVPGQGAWAGPGRIGKLAVCGGPFLRGRQLDGRPCLSGAGGLASGGFGLAAMASCR